MRTQSCNIKHIQVDVEIRFIVGEIINLQLLQLVTNTVDDAEEITVGNVVQCQLGQLTP